MSRRNRTSSHITIHFPIVAVLAVLWLPSVLGGSADPEMDAVRKLPDALRDRYKNYKPPFPEKTFRVPKDGMTLSTEKAFYTLNRGLALRKLSQTRKRNQDDGQEQRPRNRVFCSLLSSLLHSLPPLDVCG